MKVPVHTWELKPTSATTGPAGSIDPLVGLTIFIQPFIRQQASSVTPAVPTFPKVWG
jgi:hypothetical protein